jgi:hypothetical protein
MFPLGRYSLLSSVVQIGRCFAQLSGGFRPGQVGSFYPSSATRVASPPFLDLVKLILQQSIPDLSRFSLRCIRIPTKVGCSLLFNVAIIHEPLFAH